MKKFSFRMLGKKLKRDKPARKERRISFTFYRSPREFDTGGTQVIWVRGIYRATENGFSVDCRGSGCGYREIATVTKVKFTAKEGERAWVAVSGRAENRDTYEYVCPCYGVKSERYQMPHASIFDKPGHNDDVIEL